MVVFELHSAKNIVWVLGWRFKPPYHCTPLGSKGAPSIPEPGTTQGAPQGTPHGTTQGMTQGTTQGTTQGMAQGTTQGMT